MTCAFGAAMIVLVMILKIVSASQRRAPDFWLTLLLSVDSMRRVRPANRSLVLSALARCVSSVVGFAAVWLACWQVVKCTGASGIWLGWLGAPMVWLMGEALGDLTRVTLLPTGRLMPHPHSNVFASRSVADFWGRRWNVWMSDWFRQIVFHPLHQHPVFAVILVFVLSGIVHELVINLVLWLLTGRNLLGSMMAYFGLQAAGLLAERAWLAGHPRLKRFFAWLVVIGPAPLIVNEGMLRALQLWPEGP